MWFGTIDIPESIVTAHRSDALVLFVGAGASMGAPSSLPSFVALTEDIAAQSAIVLEDDEIRRPDFALERMESQGVDVHSRIADLLSDPTSEPNRLHEAVVNLALASLHLRIVTTNYDRHLSTLLDMHPKEVEEFSAPALPTGDDFEGLVYLHGDLKHPPSRLVATAEDFGRAYLVDAWATRFLERMFRTFTVLFIGYSHDDLVMSYLARALGPTSERYALTSEADDRRWKQLGIIPIRYELVAGSHAALDNAVESWANFAGMGFHRHGERIAQLVANPPPTVPEDVSYLESVLLDPPQTKIFCDLATGADWLAWVESRPPFDRLFRIVAPHHECANVLAWWFAARFVTDEVQTGAALDVVQRRGGLLGPEVWRSIATQIHSMESPRPTWINPWIVLLLENVPDNGRDLLEFILYACRLPGDEALALLLFDYLTEPTATIEPGFGAGYSRFIVEPRGSQYWLAESWGSVFHPRLPELAVRIVPILDRNLRRSNYQLTTAGAPYDPLTLTRHTIEPHEQDQAPQAVDVLIDAARDCLETLLDHGQPMGPALLDSWTSSDLPILERLAIHGWRYRSDVDATAKVRELNARGWIFDDLLRHESFQLVAAALSNADQLEADAFVASVEDWNPSEGDADQLAHVKRLILAWAAKHAPSLSSAGKAFGRKSGGRTFHEVLGPHPDLLSWSSSGLVGHVLPMGPDECHERISVDAVELIQELLELKTGELTFDRPRWSDALVLVERVVMTHPSDGLVLLQQTDLDPAFIGALIRGWSRSGLDDPTIDEIVDALNGIDLADMAGEVSYLFNNGNDGMSQWTSWHRSTSARLLAMNVWELLDTELPEGRENWLDVALNAPSGRLVLYLVRAVLATWSDDEANWKGIPADLVEKLQTLVSGDGAKTALAQVVVASQLHALFNADRAWSEIHVLPLLDWELNERASRCWCGFLVWGRWNDALLDAGLFDLYMASLDRWSTLNEDLRDQLCTHLAAVALFSARDPLIWIGQLVSRLPVPARAGWARRVSRYVGQLSADTVEHEWQRWMARYWNERLKGIPRQLEVEEASEMATWIVYLGGSAETGVELALRATLGLGQHYELLRLLATEDRFEVAPAPFSRLLAHALETVSLPIFGELYYLQQIMTRARAVLEGATLAPLEEQALRLGVFKPGTSS